MKKKKKRVKLCAPERQVKKSNSDQLNKPLPKTNDDSHRLLNN